MTMSGSLGGLWLALIGWFIVGSANTERRQARLLGGVQDLTAGDVMTRDPVLAPGWWTIDAFARHVAEDGVRHRVFPVVDFTGRPTGVVALPDLVSAGSVSRLQDAARPLGTGALAEAAEPLADVLTRADLRPGNVVVVTEDGRIAGIITAADVTRTLELRRLTAPTGSGPAAPR
jgi:Mg/Co/Ni transporter MgtE